MSLVELFVRVRNRNRVLVVKAPIASRLLRFSGARVIAVRVVMTGNAASNSRHWRPQTAQNLLEISGRLLGAWIRPRVVGVERLELRRAA